MRDISLIFAFLGAILFLIAAAAWWRVAREPEQRAEPGVELDSRSVKSAAKATSFAFGLSGIAAILAVADWVVR